MKEKAEGYSDREFNLALRKAGAQLDIYGVFGLFYGCHAAPELVMPSTYWKLVFGKEGGNFGAMEEAEKLTADIMFLWNMLAQWKPEKDGFFYPEEVYERSAEGLKKKARDIVSFVECFIKGLDLGNVGEEDLSEAGHEGIESLSKIAAMLIAYPELIDKESAYEDEPEIIKGHELMDTVIDTIGGRIAQLTRDLKPARMAVAEEMQRFTMDYQTGEQARSEKVGRNEPCPCGSGKKYKKCCGLLH